MVACHEPGSTVLSWRLRGPEIRIEQQVVNDLKPSREKEWNGEKTGGAEEDVMMTFMGPTGLGRRASRINKVGALRIVWVERCRPYCASALDDGEDRRDHELSFGGAAPVPLLNGTG